MKVCFIGFGSIASRHIRNVKELYGTDIIIDLLRTGQKSQISGYENIINKVYYSYDDLPKDYDVIFITNPTRLHYETLQQSQDYGKHFFIEKPVFETGKECLTDLHCKDDSIYYVACPLRHMNVIQYIRENIDFSKVYSVRCISSSYLPEWRPGIDYRSTYSARKELGGGVEIDLIHEWDYLCYLLGQPQKILKLSGKKSKLDINSEDIAIYIAEYYDKFVELHLDYFGRIPTRKIELYSEDDIIEADLIRQKVNYKREGKIVDLFETRDSYQKKEILHFFNIINKQCDNDNDIKTAYRTLKIARGII